jgi:hypothetical protein
MSFVVLFGLIVSQAKAWGYDRQSFYKRAMSIEAEPSLEKFKVRTIAGISE